MGIVTQQASAVYQQAGFDYEHLAPEVRTDVQESTRRIHELERRTSESIIEIGQQLIRVKQRLPHGEFLPWLASEFGWGQATAYNFIRVAEVFGDAKVTNFVSFQPSALYALASNNVPEEVREGFQQAADAGEKVTHAKVQEAIREHREQQERAAEFACPDCGELFAVEVWHCDGCDHHWSVENDDVCRNCHQERSGDYPPYEVVQPGSPGAMLTPINPAPLPPSKTAHVSNNSGENEWYTPAEYIAAAREVMGGIDLDPASSAIANETVQAETYYTKDDNGLARDWRGRVWMNPPYAQPLIQYFAEKVADEFGDGNIDEAIVLVNNATETRWFQYMARQASAVCFPAGRVRFLDPEGNPGAPLQGQAILYFGDNPTLFRERFGGFGVAL